VHDRYCGVDTCRLFGVRERHGFGAYNGPITNSFGAIQTEGCSVYSCILTTTRSLAGQSSQLCLTNTSKRYLFVVSIDVE